MSYDKRDFVDRKSDERLKQGRCELPLKGLVDGISIGVEWGKSPKDAVSEPSRRRTLIVHFGNHEPFLERTEVQVVHRWRTTSSRAVTG